MEFDTRVVSAYCTPRKAIHWNLSVSNTLNTYGTATRGILIFCNAPCPVAGTIDSIRTKTSIWTSRDVLLEWFLWATVEWSKWWESYFYKHGTWCISERTKASLSHQVLVQFTFIASPNHFLWAHSTALHWYGCHGWKLKFKFVVNLSASPKLTT